MKLLYFAQFRERLGRSEDALPVPAGVTNVGTLVEWLRRTDPVADEMLGGIKFRVSVNARFAKDDTPVDDTSVVALLPPMTGG